MKVPITLTILLTLCISAVSFCAVTETTLIEANPEANVSYLNPVWSPNGRSIVYVSVPYECAVNEPSIGKAGKSLYLATLAGGNWQHRLLAKDADWPVWSPDGKQIAFHQGGLAVMDIATGKVRILMPDKGSEIQRTPDMQIRYPIGWSPNGRYILYVTAFYENSKTSVFDLKTGAQANVVIGTDASWTADSKVISGTCGLAGEPAESLAQIAEPASGSVRTILNGQCLISPHVPRGAGYAHVWITTNPPKGEGLYRMDLKTGTLGKMLSMRGTALYWSPTGKRFAFVGEAIFKKGEQPKRFLYVGDIAATQDWAFEAVATGAAKVSGNWHDRMKYAGWSADGTSIAYVSENGDIKIVKL